MRDDPPTIRSAEGAAHWQDALLIARIAACFPSVVSGIRVRCGAGPVRDRWLHYLDSQIGDHRPRVRLPNAVSGDRLTGGVDVEASLLAGRRIFQPGLLDKVIGGIATMPMAERFPRGHAAIVASAMDRAGTDGKKPFLLIALDESEDDDFAMAPALCDRMTMTLLLDGISIHDASEDEDEEPSVILDPSQIKVSGEIVRALAELTRPLPGGGMRMLSSMVSVCRALAALAGEPEVGVDDVAKAISLCLGANLTIEAADETEETQPDNDAAQQNDTQPENSRDTSADQNEPDAKTEMPDFADMGEIILAAAKANCAIQDILHGHAADRSTTGAQTGSAGAMQNGSGRGRPAGIVTRPLKPGARPSIIATLRTAIPFQRMRVPDSDSLNRQPGVAGHIRILPSDFRYQRYKHPAESAAIFAVDASGSTALSRLSEAKGAIELLLNDCYVRRDTVALVSFRGLEATVLLEPTRSLVRAKRSLAQLPGGGPTPLADGIRLSMELADGVKRRGQTPLIVLMTDGSGNIAMGGKADRVQAHRDACGFAAMAVEKGYRTIFIDIGTRPRDAARDLASAMNAEYCPLPHVSAQAVSGIVERRLRG